MFALHGGKKKPCPKGSRRNLNQEDIKSKSKEAKSVKSQI